MRHSRVKDSVRASMRDGAAWALMGGLAEPAAIPFALALGAGPLGVGALRALPPLASAAAQVYAERLVLAFGRCKPALLLSVGVQNASLFAAACAAFLPADIALPFFIAMTAVYTAAGGLANPPWTVMMGEYIPPSRRGRFFGLRFQLVGLVFFAASMAGARLLSFWPRGALQGFAAVFIAAGAARLLSVYYLTRMYEPRTCFHLPRGAGADFARGLDFRRGKVPAVFFSVFLLLLGAHVSAPFFAVYALEDLGLDYYRYMALMSVGPLVTYLVMRRWGAAADRRGSLWVLKAAFLLVPTVPLLWTLGRNFWYLIAVECWSGVLWGAYQMGTNNFVYEAAPAHERAGYTAFFLFFSGLAQAAGSLAGGWLYGALPAWGGSPFIPLLLISAGIRLFAIAALFRLTGPAGGGKVI